MMNSLRKFDEMLTRPYGRRSILRGGVVGFGALASGPLLAACGDGQTASINSNLPDIGPLVGPDENGLYLPEGFTSEIVAQSGQEVAGTGFTWIGAPDGSASFPTADGGYIVVTNSEIPNGAGGAAAIRYARNGDIVDAYRILEGTNFNCAGGKTNNGHWISCEEDFSGYGKNYECDPTGENEAVPRPAMGVFTHEGVVSSADGTLFFQTEDQPDGRFYCFTADRANDLSSGGLEAMAVEDYEAVLAGDRSRVRWLEIPDPSASTELTRRQVPETQGFLGGEGIAIDGDHIFFTTKFNNHVYDYDMKEQTLCLLYSAERDGGLLTGVDNVTVGPGGEVIVAEDGGNMECVVLLREGDSCATSGVLPLVRVEGQENSEVTGPCASPDLRYFHFNSQRGQQGKGFFEAGISDRITGPITS